MGNFIVRGVLPTLLAVLLFVVSMFWVFLPSLEQSIMDQKREMIRELTNSAWNILAKFENDERGRLLSRVDAQARAIEQIRNLHYGIQMKDYFWINDMEPRMVIHPYRPDLDGKDLRDFADPEGKKLFVESVRVVKERGSGFITYRWQWMDDPTRIVPKISYVKGFEPWGWIIGTGIYINDVRQEIKNVTQQLVVISVGILGVVSGLMAILLWGTWQTEQQRRRSETRLRESEERYRLLVESAGDCIIMSLEGQQLFANHSMLNLLGMGPEEFSQQNLNGIVLPTEEEKTRGQMWYQALLEGKPFNRHYESFLRDRAGNLHRVMLSLSPIPRPDRPGFSLIASVMSPQQERLLNQDNLLEELQKSLMFFHQTVGELDLEPVLTASSTAPTAEVVRQVIAKGCPHVICEGNGRAVGFVSWRELLGPASGQETGPVLGVMADPVLIRPDALLFDAFLAMERRQFAPAVVIDTVGKPVALLTLQHLLQLQGYSPTILLREVQTASDPEGLVRAARRLPELVTVLMRNGARINHINKLIAAVADVVVERVIALVGTRLGPAPVPFTFLVMGSEGRREQTLRTDQDNALVFADPPPGQADMAMAYFRSMGEQVCGLLAQVGYASCLGGIMASNPAWCQPLSVWKKLFSGWVSTMEAQDLLQTKIFFDFRDAFGDRGLVNALQEHLSGELARSSRFFFLLARNVLQFEPPLDMFGNFVLSEAGPRPHALDIKAVMVQIVDFARIYALKSNIRDPGTFERLQELCRRGVLTPQSCQEMVQAHGSLMRLRLEHQVRVRTEGHEPDNFIQPEMLTSIDQKMLKEVFAQIKHFQVRLSYDFTGMMQGM